MHRILQRRKIRKLRFVWAAMAVFALVLAVCSALFTVWTWRQTRDLSVSFTTLQERLEQVNTQRREIVQLILKKREILQGRRFKRDVIFKAAVDRAAPLVNASGHKILKAALQEAVGSHSGGTGKGKNGGLRKVASHFEITKTSFQNVGDEGFIKGWVEESLNMSKAVTYKADTGTFKVERTGVYFLYCQVHFNENQSQYVKLEVSVTSGPSLQCIEGYGTTPSSGSHMFHFLKPCQVSGLLRLTKGAELRAKTAPNLILKNNGKHYFGLFKIN